MNQYQTIIVKTDPVYEAILKKLIGIDGVPIEERIEMIKRAAKAGAEVLYNLNKEKQNEMVNDFN